MKLRRVLPSQSAKFLSSLLLSSPLHSGNVELAETGGQLQEGPRIKARRADWENKLITDCPRLTPHNHRSRTNLVYFTEPPLNSCQRLSRRDNSSPRSFMFTPWKNRCVIKREEIPPHTRLCSAGGRSAEHRTSKVTLDMSNCVKICRSPF